MTCTSCGSDNAAGAKFCSACGTPLSRACPSCATVGAGRFCAECGTPLTAAAAPTVAARVVATGSVAERRIASVLFADLVGFTALSETRDPEDVRELLSRYFATCRTIIDRYGGAVEKFIGDAVMAVWGVPAAHEDDAERAVRAGIDLIDAVAALGEEVAAPGLSMRVGIVTGDVAVNVGATGEGMVAGDSVNTASRVQSAATPGQVWVDEQTRALTVAAVDYDDAGEHELKGKADAIRLFAARHVVAAVGGARRVDGLEAPFVGRDRELRLVKELFHATLEEQRPRLVAVFGAAGIGKSRLGWEFDKYVDGINDLVMVHAGRCLSYGDGVAFWAVAEMVQGRLGILEGDSPAVVVERLREGLDRYVPDSADRQWLLPRMATLLGVVDAVSPGATFARDDLFAAWRTFFEHVAHRSDAVGAFLRIDDLQWADPGLLDFIDHVLETARAPIFVLALARSELMERAPTLGTGRRATALHLEPLGAMAMARVVDGLVAGLPNGLRDALVERSEGVPLFAVETVRALIDRDLVIPQEGRYVLAPDEAGRIDLADESLPTSLHTLIASRLDGLPPDERRLVQDAAVLGQAFGRDGLAALCEAVGDVIDVAGALDALARKEIFSIESDPRSPERGQYRFVQAMVRTVAYDTLSRRDRKVRHLTAAQLLAQEPDADAIPAVIASHLVDAHAAAASDDDADELAERAVELLERAAARASSLGAPAEAHRHLQTAVSLATDPVKVAQLTESAARAAMSVSVTEAAVLAEQARAAYADLAMPVDAARSLALWGDAEIAAGFGRAVVEPLARAYDDLPDHPETARTRALLALAVARGYYVSEGDSLSAIPWFDRAVDLGEALEDYPLLASTLASYAGALVLSGRSRMGLGLLRVSLDLAREIDDQQMQMRPLNNLVSFLATRDLRAACTYVEEGLAIVRRLGDREWGAYFIGSATHVYWNAGMWDEAIALVNEVDADRAEPNPVYTLMLGYKSAIEAARGRTSPIPVVEPPASSVRSDVVLEAARALLESFRQRPHDAGAAAALSMQAAKLAAEASGIDDDFPLFWIVAVDDQISVGDAEEARTLYEMVGNAPRGHVAPLLRGLAPWVHARVRLSSDPAAPVEESFTESETALRAFGAPYYLARVLVDHAEWLDGQRRPADALPLLDEARQLFTALRAEPWLERVGGGARPVTQVVPAGT